MSCLPDERISQFGRADVEPTAAEAAHLAECAGCNNQVVEAKSLRSFFTSLPLFAPSAAFARATVAAFEAAWQRKRAKDVAKALGAGAALSLVTAGVLVMMLPITVVNTLGRLVSHATQSVRLVSHVAQGMTQLGMSVPVLLMMMVVCFATTVMIERSVRLGRRTT